MAWKLSASGTIVSLQAYFIGLRHGAAMPTMMGNTTPDPGWPSAGALLRKSALDYAAPDATSLQTRLVEQRQGPPRTSSHPVRSLEVRVADPVDEVSGGGTA